LAQNKRRVVEIADRIIRNATPRSSEEIARMWPHLKETINAAA